MAGPVRNFLSDNRDAIVPVMAVLLLVAGLLALEAVK